MELHRYGRQHGRERDLRDPGYAERVRCTLTTHGIDGHALEIEVSERVAEAADEEVLPTLDRLPSIGVRVAIDDFGTGNSGSTRLLSGRIDTPVTMCGTRVEAHVLEGLVDKLVRPPPAQYRIDSWSSLKALREYGNSGSIQNPSMPREVCIAPGMTPLRSSSRISHPDVEEQGALLVDPPLGLLGRVVVDVLTRLVDHLLDRPLHLHGHACSFRLPSDGMGTRWSMASASRRHRPSSTNSTTKSCSWV